MLSGATKNKRWKLTAEILRCNEMSVIVNVDHMLTNMAWSNDSTSVRQHFA